MPAIAATTLSLQSFIVPVHDSAHGYLPYVNPAAPKGGVIRLKAADVTYTTFNPYGIVDVPAAGIGRTFASLMVAALDDPLTVYPYLATQFDWTGTTMRVDLQEKAQFHDGTPLTGEDVQATFQALQQSDLSLHQQSLHTLERVEVPSPHTVRFIFKEKPSHETVFFLMQLPILSHFDLKEGRLPTGDSPLRSSGPYYVADYR